MPFCHYHQPNAVRFGVDCCLTSASFFCRLLQKNARKIITGRVKDGGGGGAGGGVVGGGKETEQCRGMHPRISTAWHLPASMERKRGLKIRQKLEFNGLTLTILTDNFHRVIYQICVGGLGVEGGKKRPLKTSFQIAAAATFGIGTTPLHHWSANYRLFFISAVDI